MSANHTNAVTSGCLENPALTAAKIVVWSPLLTFPDVSFPIAKSAITQCTWAMNARWTYPMTLKTTKSQHLSGASQTSSAKILGVMILQPIGNVCLSIQTDFHAMEATSVIVESVQNSQREIMCATNAFLNWGTMRKTHSAKNWQLTATPISAIVI